MEAYFNIANPQEKQKKLQEAKNVGIDLNDIAVHLKETSLTFLNICESNWMET